MESETSHFQIIAKTVKHPTEDRQTNMNSTAFGPEFGVSVGKFDFAEKA